MTAIRILFSYKPVPTPWGGANNFVRALHRALEDGQDFALSYDPDQPFDILFMNQLGKGQGNDGGHWTIREVKALLARNPHARLAVRAINLRSHSHGEGGWRGWWENARRDRESLRLLRRADRVIFQSAYQKSFFEKAGWKGSGSVVVHNGADRVFSASYTRPPLDPGEPLRLLCSVMGPRKTKRIDLAAAFSNLEGVEVSYAGQWPQTTPPAGLKRLGTLSHDELFARMRESHYFLHPAICDPCPNAMIEALNAGLPVLYNPGPGSGVEIAGSCGLPLDESNLAGTLSRARLAYADLAALTMQNRATHSIDRAAADYARLFRELAGEERRVVS